MESALQLAMAYIRYVEAYYPEVHAEADGTPSVKSAVHKALGVNDTYER